ncbi:hypothetical protein COR50_18285 [Chitinophaga caeni]|uniref:Uncharacterized protein n=1 Tax=Chitinophaga caeni TaxID=2029983 RepID=A0A291QYE9_9BACT|nr:hypothetical protein COR50_18285 [Chitinophaga caeni]
MPFPLPSDMSKVFCINPLIKITIQSKDLYVRVLQCNTRTNTAFERQTLPHNLQQVNYLLYLPYSFNAGSKKCMETRKETGFANRQFAIKA